MNGHQPYASKNISPERIAEIDAALTTNPTHRVTLRIEGKSPMAYDVHPSIGRSPYSAAITLYTNHYMLRGETVQYDVEEIGA